MFISSGPQSDFSVTSRLLPPSSSYPPPPYPYHDKVGDTKSIAPLPTPFPGWQFMLPTDQGSISTRQLHPLWRNAVPNTALPFPPASLQPPKQTITSQLASHTPAKSTSPLRPESSSLYALYQAAMVSSTSGSGESSSQPPQYSHHISNGAQHTSHSENSNTTPESKHVIATSAENCSSSEKLGSPISSGKQSE